MIRKLLLAASAVALGAGGLGLAGAASTANAAITVTANHSSHLSCDLLAAVKLKPALKDNWVKADHASDSNADVVGIANTTYASNGPVAVSVKGTATNCTGTVTDGTNTTTVSKITVQLKNDPAHLGSTDQATCLGLFNPSSGPPSTATYDAFLKYTASPYKVTPTTITNTTIAPGSFTTSGGVITGSFAGGTSTSTGIPDGTLAPPSGTLGLFVQETTGPAPDGTTVATSSHPAAPNVCQPAVKIKTGTKHSATPVKPKGMKGLSIVAGSTLVIHG